MEEATEATEDVDGVEEVITESRITSSSHSLSLSSSSDFEAASGFPVSKSEFRAKPTTKTEM